MFEAVKLTGQVLPGLAGGVVLTLLMVISVVAFFAFPVLDPDGTRRTRGTVVLCIGLAIMAAFATLTVKGMAG